MRESTNIHGEGRDGSVLPSVGFFELDWAESLVSGWLELARPERTVDKLLFKLREPGGESWVLGELRSRFAIDRPLERLVSGEVSLERLIEIKEQSKRIFQPRDFKEAILAGVAGYFLSVAAALTHYGTLISTQGRDRVDPVLVDLERALSRPWRELLRSARCCRQQFPLTDDRRVRDWIRVSPEEPESLARQVMERYYRPLQVYFLGSSFRELGDAEELVGQFFADRLQNRSFFERWRERCEEVSESIRLRVWLMSSFKQFLIEEAARQNRNRTRQADTLPPEDTLAGRNHPERDYARAVALELVRSACEETRRICERNGDERMWTALVAKHYFGRRYREIADALGVSESGVRALAIAGQEEVRRCLPPSTARRGRTRRPGRPGDPRAHRALRRIGQRNRPSRSPSVAHAAEETMRCSPPPRESGFRKPGWDERDPSTSNPIARSP